MSRCVLIAAGGTGGHIYPALAVAKALLQIEPDLRVHFVGTARGLENTLIPREGYPLHHLSVGRLNRNVGWGERILTMIQLPWSFVQSAFLILRQRPVCVLGVGGHASGPLLLTAALLGRRTAIWEPNAYPGLANRILSRFMGATLVVFVETKKYLHSRHVEVVGLPVRTEIAALHRESVRIHEPPHLLIFGGSQGAQHVNTVVAETFKNPKWRGRITVTHQTGSNDHSRVLNLYGQVPPGVEVLSYLHDMHERYRAADLVIARAGTGTLFELAAAKRASILIPLPSAADNHQQKNAEVFAAAGGAVMVLQRQFTTESLSRWIETLLAAPNQMVQMAEKVAKFFTPKAAEEIAKFLLQDSFRG
jgi:UDP-N-acetylglucosamine--N-acetylmuramyl-(pentapeptide) pyrophosphoryl-undecaprenol N-acetylglucosamine transferase